MKKPQIIGLLIFSLLAARGALAQKVTLEFDRDADFTKYFRNSQRGIKQQESRAEQLPREETDGGRHRARSDCEGADGDLRSRRLERRPPVRIGTEDGASDVSTRMVGVGHTRCASPACRRHSGCGLAGSACAFAGAARHRRRIEKRPDQDRGPIGRCGKEILRAMPAEEVTLGNPSVEERRFRIQSVLPYIAIAAKGPQSKRSGEWRTERK